MLFPLIGVRASTTPLAARLFLGFMGFTQMGAFALSDSTTPA